MLLSTILSSIYKSSALGTTNLQLMATAQRHEVEINEDLAARQPEDQWLARADWQAHDYQSRLRGAASGPATAAK